MDVSILKRTIDLELKYSLNIRRDHILPDVSIHLQAEVLYIKVSAQGFTIGKPEMSIENYDQKRDLVFCYSQLKDETYEANFPLNDLLRHPFFPTYFGIMRCKIQDEYNHSVTLDVGILFDVKMFATQK